MYDINFIQKADVLKKDLMQGHVTSKDIIKIEQQLESLRSHNPHVFNIETTNHCNMTCIMCPRTSLMTRDIDWIDDQTFENVLDQMTPHTPESMKSFWDFINTEYGINFDQHSENAFYFYVVSRCVILHGYGEPLVDKNIVNRVQACTDRNIPTYFSCVPANLSVKRAESIMEAGLTVLKCSIDALDDSNAKRIRGKYNNFEKAYQTIKDVIAMKEAKGYKTLIVPTMIELNENSDNREMQQVFMDMWKDLDVYAYVKSQDNRWYYEEDNEMTNKSHYAQQYCEYPWSSMTVMANGDVVPCTQDYNCEMKLGNVKEDSLEEIWNGDKYKFLREWHLNGNFPANHKCANRCDQTKLHQVINRKSGGTEK